MKKRNLIFLILAMLLLAGCSGLQGSRTAAAAAFPGGAELTLSVGATINPGDLSAYGGMRLRNVSDPLLDTAFLQRLAPEAAITEYCNAYGPCLLLDQNGSRYFLGQLPSSGAAEQKDYEFSGMRRTVQMGNETSVDILLPLHCVEDPRIRDSLGFRLSPGDWYACGLSQNGVSLPLADLKDCFYTFYDSTGGVQAAWQGEQLQAVWDGGAVLLDFSEQDGQCYFRISY